MSSNTTPAPAVQATDEQVRAMLAVQWPALYRDSLYMDGDGDGLRRQTQERVAIARRQYAAALSVQPATQPAVQSYGCHCDLEPGMQPDGCVIDAGRPEDCVKSRRGGIARKEDCPEWRPIAVVGLSVQPVPDAPSALGVAASPPGSTLKPCGHAAIPNAGSPINFRLALNVKHPDCHRAADAFWAYWERIGETHRHGYYESTRGAINQALRMVGVVPWDYGLPPARGMEARSGETEGLDPKGDSPVPSGTRPETAPETTAQTAPQAEPSDAELRAFEKGWRTASNWMERDDLIADIGSLAYLKDRDAALKQQEQTL